MRRAGLPMLLVALGGALSAPAAAQAPPGHFLAADASRTGVINLVFFGPEGGVVEFRERVGATRVTLARETVPAQIPAAIAREATTWRCDRRVRRFEATETLPYGRTLEGSFEVRTPSCRDRLDVLLPTRVRRGTTATLRVRDRWKLGGMKPRVCIDPPGRARARCRTLPFGRGASSASRRFAFERSGTWRVTVRLGVHRFRRALAVGRRAAPAPPARPVYLTTGDSTIQGLDGFLADELGTRADVRSEYFVGTGLSSATSPWPDLPAAQIRRFAPSATVISIGANEGRPLGGVECCGEAWIARYAQRVTAMMRTYRRVVWLTLPAPRDEKRRPITAAVNTAIVRAANGTRGVRLVRLDELFTPGGVYRERIRFRGQDITVRQTDGIHLTLPALSIAAGLVADALPSPRR